jgi:hypothetical protein
MAQDMTLRSRRTSRTYPRARGGGPCASVGDSIDRMIDDANKMLAHAIELRDEIAAGRFVSERSRRLAQILGYWVDAAKAQEPDDATVKKVDDVYREIQRRFAAH